LFYVIYFIRFSTFCKLKRIILSLIILTTNSNRANRDHGRRSSYNIARPLFIYTNVKFVIRDCPTLYQDGKIAIN